ncbi:hypothetical protein GCM10009854_41510 [Saccharopolyspora halophila]|uniref:Uncharacterized protein n=1 Tax=Saccharopolyspora halophila TaxID=405551 RepID=A0ABN3GQX4_9PSEU
MLVFEGPEVPGFRALAQMALAGVLVDHTARFPLPLADDGASLRAVRGTTLRGRQFITSSTHAPAGRGGARARPVVHQCWCDATSPTARLRLTGFDHFSQ